MSALDDHELRALVRAQRLAAGMLTYEDAGRAGGVSRETWRKYEAGEPLGRAMIRAVAQAFSWAEDWYTNPPALARSAVEFDHLAALGRQMLERLDAIEQQLTRLDAIEQGVAALAQSVAALAEEVRRQRRPSGGRGRAGGGAAQSS